MIQYDAHIWYDHLLDIKGSMLREVLGRVTLCVMWAVMVYSVDYLLTERQFHPLAIPETAHTLVGAILGLLLVFRTNASYDRFWEGRRIWGSMVNECRNIARMSRVWLLADQQLVRNVNEWTAAYPWAVMHRLRGTKGLAPDELKLPAQEIASVLEAPHPPLAIAHRISQLYAGARGSGMISDLQLVSLESNVQRLVDYLGGCERIQNTPMPYAYMVHLRRALIVYCFTLPFALIGRFDWLMIPITMLIAYVIFGIEEIGVEIENPFGTDDNDLPLELLCTNIARNVRGNSAG